MQLKAKRLRKFEKRSKFYRENLIFKSDVKTFFQEIGKETITVDDAPLIKEVEDFLKDLQSEGKGFNKQAEWMKHTEEINLTKKHQESVGRKVSKDELEFELNKSHKWKSPGMDKVPNFWISSLSVSEKKFTSIMRITSILYEIVESPDRAPKWLSEGITYLSPKTKNTKNPQNSRPSTFLTSTHNLLTSFLTKRSYTFMENNNAFPNSAEGVYKRLLWV